MNRAQFVLLSIVALLVASGLFGLISCGGNDGDQYDRLELLTGQIPRAFHIVQHADVKDGKFDLSAYSILVCNASLEPAMLREAGADGTILANIDVKGIPTYGGSPTYENWRAAIVDPEWYYQTEDGKRVPLGDYEAWALRPDLEAMEALAQWAAAEFADWGAEAGSGIGLSGQGGVYVDQLTPGLSPHLRKDLELKGALVESDDAYTQAAEFFVQRLRQLAPDPFVIVGNTWGPADLDRVPANLSVPTRALMNGVTIEDAVLEDVPFWTETARLVRARGVPVVQIAWYRDWAMEDDLGPILLAGTTWREDVTEGSP